MSGLWILLRRLLLTRLFLSSLPSLLLSPSFSLFLIRCISEKKDPTLFPVSAKNYCRTRYTTHLLDSGVASGTYFHFTRYLTLFPQVLFAGMGDSFCIGLSILQSTHLDLAEIIFFFSFSPFRAFCGISIF